MWLKRRRKRIPGRGVVVNLHSSYYPCYSYGLAFLCRPPKTLSRIIMRNGERKKRRKGERRKGIYNINLFQHGRMRHWSCGGVYILHVTWRNIVLACHSSLVSYAEKTDTRDGGPPSSLWFPVCKCCYGVSSMLQIMY